MIDWEMTEVQGLFAGVRDQELIDIESNRLLLKDLNRGYRTYLATKCEASARTWELYTSCKFTGLEHCRLNGVSRLKQRKAKANLLANTKELYNRLTDENDTCADLVGDGLDSKMLSESDLVHRLKKKYEATERYKTNWSKMDDVLQNWSKGDVMLLCGLSNTGKTSFALQVSYFANHKTLYYGVDMTVEALADRILKTEWYMRNASPFECTLEDRRKCDDAVKSQVVNSQAVIEQGIKVYDSDRMTLEQIEYSAKRELETFDAEVLIIDYAGRIDNDGKPQEQWREDARIARAIKGMAKRLNIRVIALAQFNSNAKKFVKPENSWISGSKELISACDLVVSLWQNANSEGEINYTELNVSDQIKNRDSGVHDDFILSQYGTFLYE